MVRSERTRIGLAPMEGVTDFAVRLWFHMTSAPDFMGTPFLRATATYPHDTLSPKYAPELFELRGKIPYGLIPQVMASDAAHAERAFAMLLDHASVVDLNCGCPAPTVVGHGAGSSILTSPERFEATALRLTRFCGPARLSIKMRTGFEDESLFDELMDALRSAPLQRLTLHGRTRAQRYTGKARWDLIARAAATLPYPVTGSGDVVDAASLAARLGIAPLGTVIVGRGALRNPWVFSELRTGEPQRITWRALAEALGVLALLAQLHEEKWDTLLSWAEGHDFSTRPGTDADAWHALRRELMECVDKAPSRVTLGRVKMIWTYLRTSLPDAFLDRALLRAASVDEFLERLRGIASHETDDSVELRYYSERDRLWRDGATDAGASAPHVTGAPALA